MDATGSTNGPCLQLADRTGAAQQQPSSHLGKSWGRLDPPQSSCFTAATESKIPLQNCHLQIAATFLFIPGKEKRTLYPTKLLLGNGSNPEALLKDDWTMLSVSSTKGTKVYETNQDHLQPMQVVSPPRSPQYHKPGQLLGDEKYNQIIPRGIRGGLRTRHKQQLPWEVPSSWDGQGEHPAEPEWASTPSQVWAIQGKSHSHCWQVRLTPLPLCT